MAVYEVIGKRIPLIDSGPKSRGQIQYLDDLKLTHLLHGKILASPLPHAKILNIDTSRAKALPGVKAVITGSDYPEVVFGSIVKGADHHALALGKVRHVGDSVAAVAAIDEEIAQEALELIKVDYEPLPVVYDPLEAIRPEAPLIHENLGSNICTRVSKSFGDVIKGFAESEYIREDTYYTVANNHVALETHGVVSQWNTDGTLTHWCSNQTPYMLRRTISKALGLPEDKVRIIQPAVGGGFGGKIEACSFDLSAALLSKITGRPVKIVLSREDVFLCTRQRHPMIIKVRTGAKKDGTLISQDFKVIADCGAYSGLGPIVLVLNSYVLMVPYILQNFRYEGMRVLTNKPVGGPLRGHGAPQARFAVESHIDMMAKDLGIDPAEMRLKSLVYAGYNHPAKQRISSCGLKEGIEKVMDALQWHDRKGKMPEGRGLGLASSGLFCGLKSMFHTGGSLVIEINIDGGVNILCGASDIGQGAKTVVSQIVAEELGCRMEDIRITDPDTSITPYDVGTFGSGVTFRMGNASIIAARDVKKKLLQAVAPKLEASPEELECKGGKIFVRGHEEKGIDFVEGVRIYRYAGNPTPLVGSGYYEVDSEVGYALATKEGQFTPVYAFIAQGVEVEVDKETGQFKILRVVTADDCGQMINPLSVEGQLDGSAAGGLSMGIFEEFPYSDGQYLNASLLDYLIPTAPDMPSRMESVLVENTDPMGPFGAKEAGEGVLVPTAPAIANAIYDAVGVRINDLPITADKIKKALENKKGQ